jgi:hypothetical protein
MWHIDEPGENLIDQEQGTLEAVHDTREQSGQLVP